jgi:hypothetical protein
MQLFVIFELHNALDFVRFVVLMLMSMKMSVLWDIVPCNLVDTELHFREVTTSIMMKEAVRSSETSISIYEITWCSIPADSNLHTLDFV